MSRSPDSLLARPHNHNLARGLWVQITTKSSFGVCHSPPMCETTLSKVLRTLGTLARFRLWEPELLLLLLMLVVIHTMRTTISTIHTIRTWSAYRYFYYIFIYTIREQHFAMFTLWEPWAAWVYTLIGCVQYLIALELLFPSSRKFQWPSSPWILLFDVVFWWFRQYCGFLCGAICGFYWSWVFMIL
jgi:hypothetical protein